MKIAMLGVKGCPAIGGIARYVEEVGSRLVERGHEVTVYCRPHYMEGEGDYRGMRRAVTRGFRGKHLDALTHTLTAALCALRDDFDVAHIHALGPGVVAPMFGWPSRTKTVFTIHGLDWQRAKWSGPASACLRAGAWLGTRFSDTVASVSHTVGRDFSEEFGRLPRTVVTGMDLPELAQADSIRELDLEPNGYVLTTSRLIPEKGLHYLVEAFEQIDTDSKLVIAGSSPYEDAYTRELLSHESDRILFPGYVTGRLLAELYSNARVYVQASEIEGLSVSVLEALSYGRCVLASDIAPNVEALNGCGYTFRCGDVADLRNRLGELLARDDVAEEQFDLARRYIREKRSWDRTVDAYEKLYQEALSGSTAAVRERQSTEACAEPRRS
ncbi:MAG: glycosyltransferase [Armatimonadia bacterium]|nr:glycosyltransferase [Armatimonadia bacterium]